MTLTELLPEIRSLARGEKLQLIQLLASDIAREEQILSGWKDSSAPVWSPYESTDAAQMLMQLLAAEKAGQ